MTTESKAERQRRIARLLAQQPVGSQSELVELLASAGPAATQATVSRDLEELGAVKVRRAGRVVYALPASDVPGAPARPGGEALRRLLADSVGSVEATGNLVVVRTPPGHAAMVASAIDQGSIGGVAGTIAGDDTILVVCREGFEAGGVAARLGGLTEF